MSSVLINVTHINLIRGTNYMNKLKYNKTNVREVSYSHVIFF